MRGKVPAGFPTRLRLMSQDWDVEYASNLQDARNQYGQTCIPRRRILVDTEQARDAIASTLLHETLHALWAKTPLAYEVDDALEEKVVRALEPLLLDFLRKNKPWW